jgi:hypothetical protein
MLNPEYNKLTSSIQLAALFAHALSEYLKAFCSRHYTWQLGLVIGESDSCSLLDQPRQHTSSHQTTAGRNHDGINFDGTFLVADGYICRNADSDFRTILYRSGDNGLP